MRSSIVRPLLRAAARPVARAPLPRLAAGNAHAASRGSAKQQMLTLSEIDRLLTHIAQSSDKTQSDTPLVMRGHPIPWMHAGSGSPDLQGNTASQPPSVGPELTEQEKAELARPKHMSASFTSFDLPLATNPRLYDKYVNFSGGFRMGKILENLDSLAGAVAYRHCLVDSHPADGRATESFYEDAHRAGIYLATASADRLDMFGKLNHQNVRDLKFSGFVTWTGNSSMEVFAKIEGTRPGENKSDTLMLGRFSMVCRDSHTHKARKVPPLIVETEEEKALWDIGQEHKDKRAAFSKVNLDKQPPSKEEAVELHKFMLEVRDKTELNGRKLVPMKDTEEQSLQLMFPQERNLHGKVFGGFLMRMVSSILKLNSDATGFLCFTNAALFAQQQMYFIALDQITFRLPVPIGAVVRLTSKIARTTGPDETGESTASLIVKAEVEEVDTGLRRETNTFFFTLGTKGDIDVVVPDTYIEAMQYVEAGRRLAVGSEMRRMYRAKGLEQGSQ